MAKRVRVNKPTETEVLINSRRRCCICFGLERDEEIKRGQIAHLDGDSSNNDPDNLAFLCFNHDDELDRKTSKSKRLTIEEVRAYRDELYKKYALWGAGQKQYHLLNFLAYNIDINILANAAVKVGGHMVSYGEIHALDVLTAKEVMYSDWDLIMPHLNALDHYASWGLLTFEYEEIDEDGSSFVIINVNHEPICEKIANVIRERIDAQKQK
jgi:hypothetical protein